MKVASLLILLPAAAAADSQSVNQARSVNPNLRGGVRKQSHRREGHSLLEEFRQQRVHKKDIIEEDDGPDAADQAVVDDAVGAGEQSVGAGKYFDHHDDDNLHEKSLARKKKARQNVFRTSRLSRGEMEKRAEEMKSKLQQVEEGTLQLNEKTVDRYKKFVDRYNELEKEIYRMNHPEEKEKEEDAKQHTANTGSNTEAAEEKKSTSAYSSGKAEYEKSIEQMKEKKEMDVMNAMIQKDKEVSGSSSVAKVVTEGGEEEKDTKKVTTPGKTTSSEYVYAADGSKQMKTMDDDDISQLEKPDEIGSKDNKGNNNFEVVSKGGKSSTPNEDDDIPPNFEGLAEGKMATNTAEKTSTKTVVVSKGNKSDADDQDDDIPPNWEGLVDGIGPHDVVSEGVTVEEEEPEEETVVNNTRQRGNDEIPTDIVSVEDSLGKVKKLADKVGSTAEEVPKKSVEKKVKTAQKDEEGDTEETPVAVGKTATTPLKEEGGDDGAEDAGTDEMDKDTLPKLQPETSEGQKSVERGMNADGEER